MVGSQFGKLMDINFKRDLFLTDKLLVLDGLTGTGKTMISNVLESFERVEAGRFIYDVEHISIAQALGALTPDAGNSLLGLLIDGKLYDNLISREVNFRPSDLSSVLANGRALKYIKRLFKPDGEAVMGRLSEEKPIMMINTHQLLGVMDCLFEQFENKVYVIEMERHPLYLLEHWMSYMDMHGTSPRDFTVWIADKDNNSVPWFAYEWRDDYWSMTKFDRVVKSLETLTDHIDSQYEKHPNSRLISIPFEDFCLNSDKYIGEISSWLGTSKTSRTRKSCKRQRLPRNNINDGLNRKIYQRYGYKNINKLQTHAENYAAKQAYADMYQSETSAPILKKLIKRYEKRFGLWF